MLELWVIPKERQTSIPHPINGRAISSDPSSPRAGLANRPPLLFSRSSCAIIAAQFQFLD